MRFTSTIFVFLVFVQYIGCQNHLCYDKKNVSTDSELNIAFTGKRGIKDKDDIVYYVENNLKILTAYENDRIKWRINILKACGNPDVGAYEIRFIRLKGNKIFITFGKHSFASVNIDNGKVECLGSD